MILVNCYPHVILANKYTVPLNDSWQQSVTLHIECVLYNKVRLAHCLTWWSFTQLGHFILSYSLCEMIPESCLKLVLLVQMLQSVYNVIWRIML